MMRGFPTVEVITPNAGPAAKSLIGFPNFGVFVKLKNSARKSRTCLSVNANDR
jgi:hypothetical protein